MGRAPCCDKANVKKGPWSPEEDSKLKEFIEKYGTGGNWIALPQKAGLKRCGKSCRLRWLNYLRPNIKHGEFSDEEDRIICTLFSTIGSRWSIIAAQLPGRTDNDVKNYWNTKLKKKLMALIPQSQIKSLPFQYDPSLFKDYNSSASYPYLISPIPSLNFFQDQEGLLNPMQYHHHHQAMVEKDNNMLLVFGSEASCSSNNFDGSCSKISYGREIKQEEIGFQSFISNGYEENQKFTLIYSSSNDDDDHHQEQNLKQWNGSTEDQEANWKIGCLKEIAKLEYDLEDVKQLISSHSSSSNSELFIDETKEQDKFMYFY